MLWLVVFCSMTMCIAVSQLMYTRPPLERVVHACKHITVHHASLNLCNHHIYARHDKTRPLSGKHFVILIPWETLCVSNQWLSYTQHLIFQVNIIPKIFSKRISLKKHYAPINIYHVSFGSMHPNTFILAMTRDIHLEERSHGMH